MRARSYLLLMAMYFAVMLVMATMVMGTVHAKEFMKHDEIMDGFAHVQKAPQFGRPMIYLPTKKIFKGYTHKKGAPHGTQKFSRKRVTPVATPTVTPSASPSDSGVLVPGNGSSGNGEASIGTGYADLRARDSAIKSQIGPICTAYAGAAGIENLLGKSTEDLSEKHIFSMYNRYSVEAFASYVPGNVITTNNMWPRDGSAKSGYLDYAKHKLIKISFIGDGDIKAMKAALTLSHPVYMGFEVPADMASCLSSIRPATKVTRGGHAVLVVGFKDDESNAALGGGYMIIKNSWGEECGDHGYQYMPYSYCEKSYCYFYEMSEAL